LTLATRSIDLRAFTAVEKHFTTPKACLNLSKPVRGLLARVRAC
jgi:hypothetical protein